MDARLVALDHQSPKREQGSRASTRRGRERKRADTDTLGGKIDPGSSATLKKDSTVKHGLGGSVVAIRPSGGDRLGADCHTSTATAADPQGSTKGRRREAPDQRERPSLRNVA